MSKGALARGSIATPLKDQLEPVGKGNDLSMGGRLGRSALALNQLRERVIEDSRKQGYGRGFDQGLAEGRDQALQQILIVEHEKLAEFTAGLQEALSSIEFAVADWLRASEPALAELGAVIASRIIGEELTMSPDKITSVVKEALKQVTHAKTAKIRLNPFDALAVRDRQDALLSAAESLEGIEIVSDSRIVAGCRIETEGGIIDGTIESQLTMAVQAIREAA